VFLHPINLLPNTFNSFPASIIPLIAAPLISLLIPLNSHRSIIAFETILILEYPSNVNGELPLADLIITSVNVSKLESDESEIMENLMFEEYKASSNRNEQDVILFEPETLHNNELYSSIEYFILNLRLIKSLSPESPIYPLLSPLLFFLEDKEELVGVFMILMVEGVRVSAVYAVMVVPDSTIVDVITDSFIT
jgi:hypothetical protein